MHIPYNGDTGGGCCSGLKHRPCRCAVADYEELSWIKIVHGEKIRSLRRPRCGGLFLSLAAGLGAFPAWSFAASLVLASAPMLTLDRVQHSVTLNVDATHGAALRQIAQGLPASLPGEPAVYRSALLVLDEVALTDAGAKGGYFYKIYLAPVGDARASEQGLVGTLGPFEIAAARQRGTASLSYSLDAVLRGGGKNMSSLVVTFQRAGGVDGALLRIGSLQIALSTD